MVWDEFTGTLPPPSHLPVRLDALGPKVSPLECECARHAHVAALLSYSRSGGSSLHLQPRKVWLLLGVGAPRMNSKFQKNTKQNLKNLSLWDIKHEL